MSEVAGSVKPYGAWPSPIEAKDLVVGAAGLSEIVTDGGDVWFNESRPEEGGRVAILRWRNGTISEVTATDADVSTRVHEYGGGAWWVGGGTLWYVDDADQRLRRLDEDGTLTLLTPEPDQPKAVRFADGRATPDKAWFICVRETHSVGEGQPVNDLVAVAGDGSGNVVVLAEGADFYSSPRFEAGVGAVGPSEYVLGRNGALARRPCRWPACEPPPGWRPSRASRRGLPRLHCRRSSLGG